MDDTCSDISVTAACGWDDTDQQEIESNQTRCLSSLSDFQSMNPVTSVLLSEASTSQQQSMSKDHHVVFVKQIGKLQNHSSQHFDHWIIKTPSDQLW